MKNDESSSSNSSIENDQSKEKTWKKLSRPPKRRIHEKEENMKLWGILVFGIIGATATTFAIGHLRRTLDFLSTQFTRSQSTGRQSNGKSFRSSFQEEAWKKYNRRMQEEYEEEMERIERIRRMQSVFNRERDKYKKSYESWRENGQGEYHQHFQRDDWYWKGDTTHKERKTNFREPPGGSLGYQLSHHYAVLGLNRSRTEPYTESEIKTAFRTKAKEFHPDQNQDDKVAAEAKFKEVMTSYEAIKKERKDMRA